MYFLQNVLAGALFHPLLATVLLTSLTTIGSVLATLIAAPLAPVLTRFFPRPIELTRIALEGSTAAAAASLTIDDDDDDDDSTPRVSDAKSSGTPAWVRLSILRLIGIVPWSGLNVACGLTGVRLADCALGAFIGTLPWTAVTCHIGDILQTFMVPSDISSSASAQQQQSLSSILMSPKVVLELIVFSVISIAPILARERLARLIGLGSPASSSSSDSDSDSESNATVITVATMNSHIDSDAEEELKLESLDNVNDFDLNNSDEKMQQKISNEKLSPYDLVSILFRVRIRPARWYNSLFGRAAASLYARSGQGREDVVLASVPSDAGLYIALKEQR